MFNGIPSRVWVVVSLCVVLSGVFGFIIGDNHTQIANVFKPTAIPTRQSFTMQDILNEMSTPRDVPFCDMPKYTSAYRDLLGLWDYGTHQSNLIDVLNTIKPPAECSEIQNRLIDRLELAARTGVLAITSDEVKAAKKEMREVISLLEYP